MEYQRRASATSLKTALECHSECIGLERINPQVFEINLLW